jgi:hypothetical protein
MMDLIAVGAPLSSGPYRDPNKMFNTAHFQSQPETSIGPRGSLKRSS